MTNQQESRGAPPGQTGPGQRSGQAPLGHAGYTAPGQSGQSGYTEQSGQAGHASGQTAQNGQQTPPVYCEYSPDGRPPLSADEMIRWDEYQRKLRRGRFLKFPYPVLVVLAYLFLGFVFGWWHPMWMLFLTIPLYYGMAASI